VSTQTAVIVPITPLAGHVKSDTRKTPPEHFLLFLTPFSYPHPNTSRLEKVQNMGLKCSDRALTTMHEAVVQYPALQNQIKSNQLPCFLCFLGGPTNLVDAIDHNLGEETPMSFNCTCLLRRDRSHMGRHRYSTRESRYVNP
jgi:hypothetical protein